MLIDVSWPLFIVASLVLIAAPGQDMALVMSRAISQGVPAGLATAAGVSVGLLGHTALAALGLGALLQASAGLFLALKLAGAAYLVYLGVGLLRSKASPPSTAAQAPRRPLARLFTDGMLSNLSNPKVALFYFAFLPQFVRPGATPPAVSILALGAAYAALCFMVKGPVALASGLLSSWLRSRPAAMAWLLRCSGALLIGLGIKLALERRP